MKIRVDAVACRDPLSCRLCLDRCPEKVFGTYPRKKRGPDREARDWVVFPMLASECTGCRECLDFCPRGAISLG